MAPLNPYAVSATDPLAVLAMMRANDFVLVVDGKAVVETRSTGTFFMTYRTERGANIALRRVQAHLPDVEVEQR